MVDDVGAAQGNLVLRREVEYPYCSVALKRRLLVKKEFSLAVSVFIRSLETE